MQAREHVLVVGGGRELPALLRGARPGCRTSVLCQLSLLPRLRDVEGHQRVIALRPDSGDREWIAAARSVHATDPVTRIATSASGTSTAPPSSVPTSACRPTRPGPSPPYTTSSSCDGRWRTRAWSS